MKKCQLGLALLLGWVTAPLGGQPIDMIPGKLESMAEQPTGDRRALLANSTRDYPVTPGDVYILSYVTARGFQSFEFMVRGDYSVNLNVFGNIIAKDLTYLQFAKQAEERVQHAYLDSKPQCRLKATGVFTVDIEGEVIAAARIECWGLTTLAEVLQGRTTSHASLREVAIASNEGNTVRTFDLFLAARFGRKDQNPYVKPGDRVTVRKAGRQITVRGEVFRPGTYELKDGEGWQDLFTRYADGFTTLSDASRIQLKRSQTKAKQQGESLVLDATQTMPAEIPLLPLDEITVPSRKENLAVVYFEGAIGPTTDAVSGRYAHILNEGDRLSAVVREVQKLFTPSADLKAAYIIRREHLEPIPVNLETLLFAYSPKADIGLQPFDRVILPLRQQFVTVSGAVLLPGRFPYVPDRSYHYYLQLAGGADPQKNADNSVTISDVYDAKQPLDRVIQPEDKILAEYNNGLFYVQQWGIVITTGISVAALVVSIIQLTR